MLEFFLISISCLFCISLYFNVKFGIIILKIEDAIEESLDILDKKYLAFSKILEKPVFFDSVEVRQVIQEIREAQASILEIANKLSSPMENTNEEKE